MPANCKRPLLRLADRIFGHALCITQQKLDIIMGVVGPRLGLAGNGAPVVAFFDDDDDDEFDDEEEPNYWKFQNGIAGIPIHGTLVKRAGGLSAMSGMASYESLKIKLTQALEDPNVKGIVFDVDSPGGESDGMFDLADYMYSQRGQKPMTAVCNDQMCSAAYALGSACDLVYTTRTGMIGSVGCYMLHIDQSEYDKQKGLKYTYVQAGEKKIEGNPHAPLDKDAEATMKAEVTRIRDMFVQLVARNRGVSAESVLATQAGIEFGPAGIPLFADRLGTFDDAVTNMLMLVGANQPGDKEGDDLDPQMLLDEAPAAAAAAAMAAIAATAVIAHAKPGIEIESLTVNGHPVPYSLIPLGSIKSGFANFSVNGTGTVLTDISGASFCSIESAAADKQCSQCSGTGECADCEGAGEMEGGAKCAECDGTGKCMSCDGTGRVDSLASPSLVVAASRLRTEQDAVRALNPKAQPRVLQLPGMKSLAGESRRISMLVVPYDGSMSINLGGFREVYQRGCFAEGLDNDPRALFNHDEACVLGRKSAGTARFWEEADGVHVEADAPETAWANDLLVSMRRGDITQASAAFWILQQRWEVRGNDKVRVVEKALLRDASVLAFAAYESTSASVPPAPAAAQHMFTELDGARLRLLRLR